MSLFTIPIAEFETFFRKMEISHAEPTRLYPIPLSVLVTQLESHCLRLELEKASKKLEEIVVRGLQHCPTVRSCFLRFAHVQRVTQMFLAHGFCINLRHNGATPLTTTLMTDAPPKQIRSLLDMRADPNKCVLGVNPVGYALCSPSTPAQKIAKVRLLLLYGGRINLHIRTPYPGPSADTALEWAKEASDWSRIQLLAEESSNPGYVAAVCSILKSDSNYIFGDIEKALHLSLPNSTMYNTLLQASQPWTPDSDWIFPESFRKVSAIVLGVATTLNNTDLSLHLPLCILNIVLALCERTWFQHN